MADRQGNLGRRGEAEALAADIRRADCQIVVTDAERVEHGGGAVLGVVARVEAEGGVGVAGLDALDDLLVDDVGLVEAGLGAGALVAVGVVDLDHERRAELLPAVGRGREGLPHHRVVRIVAQTTNPSTNEPTESTTEVEYKDVPEIKAP